MRVLVFILSATTSWGQTTVSGKLSLCENFAYNVSVQGKLSFSYPKAKRKRQVKPKVDTLRADILVFKNELVIAKEVTNTKGDFVFVIPNPGNYKVRFLVHKLIYTDTLIVVNSDKVSFNICLTDSALHNYYFRHVGFDSARAIDDLANDTVRLVSLYSDQFSGCRISILDYLSNDDIKSIEDEFGFKYAGLLRHAPQSYCDQREKEYNQVMYNYLDKRLGGDSRQIIREKIMELARRRRAEQN